MLSTCHAGIWQAHDMQAHNPIGICTKLAKYFQTTTLNRNRSTETNTVQLPY